jgi:GH15 family glucan-1,4-alpha-glucosidase
MSTTTPSRLESRSRTEVYRPVEYLDGYLLIEDHGLIGDGTTAALVGRDGTISWLCVPRFDSVPIFDAILDRTIGGAFSISGGEIKGARHRYLGDTSILITEIAVTTGIIRITDLMPLRDNADLDMEGNPNTGELLRCVEVLEGDVEIAASLSMRGGIRTEPCPGGVKILSARFPDLGLILEASRELVGPGGVWSMTQGESVSLCLRWNGGVGMSSVHSPVAAITNTTEGWLSWLRAFDYGGPHRNLVRRSAITIKLLDYLPNGAMVAAPTTSLPEHIGGERNWDYRFVWVRDASFTVYALRRIGLHAEAEQFLMWIMARCRHTDVNIMYTLDGDTRIEERLDPELEGYRESRPVRWGNGASGQVQHDVYGELVDLAYQYANHGGAIDPELWDRLKFFIEQAAEKWNSPDRGIWEVRSEGVVQTYSAGICHVALDRGVRLVREHGYTGDAERWERIAEEIRTTILEQSWSEERQSFCQSFEGDALDAAILGLPLRRVIPADHPRMVKTTEAIERGLGAGDGLLYRYRHDEVTDGLSGDEGAFLLCSFWLIDNLTLQGRIDEAVERFDWMCQRTNDLGLLPEQIDPRTGGFLGNFPQAFSHLGLILSGVNLWRAGKS